jgi:hypothetical protein
VSACPLDAAAYYHNRVWAIVPVPRGEKAPIQSGWCDKRFGEDIPKWFSHNPNVAVILGPRSGDLVDIDLDCPEGIELADLYLPPTGAIFGRAGKPRSHRFYIAPDAIKEAFADPISGEMLVELRAAGRSGGCHCTVVPPSVHPSGERIEWCGDAVAPTGLDARVLRRRAAWLAIACIVARYVSEQAAQRPGPDLPRVLWECDRELGRVAFRWLGQSDPDAPQRTPRPQASQHQRDLDLAEVVAAIPNNCDWETWNRVGMAIFAAAKDEGDGQVVFDDFSAKSFKYNSRTTEERWRGYRRSPPTRIGMGTLVYLARQAGWKPKRGAA